MNKFCEYMYERTELIIKLNKLNLQLEEIKKQIRLTERKILRIGKKYKNEQGASESSESL